MKKALGDKSCKGQRNQRNRIRSSIRASRTPHR
jgi:hypothetical protein